MRGRVLCPVRKPVAFNRPLAPDTTHYHHGERQNASPGGLDPKAQARFISFVDVSLGKLTIHQSRYCDPSDWFNCSYLNKGSRMF